jgi:hypothetical protein
LSIFITGDDFTSTFESIEGYLVLENSSDADVNGRIVIMKQVPQQVIYAGFFALQARGAIGILYVTRTRKCRLGLVKSALTLAPKLMVLSNIQY